MCTKNFTSTKKSYVHKIAVVNLSKIYFLKSTKKTCKPNNRDLNRHWIVNIIIYYLLFIIFSLLFGNHSIMGDDSATLVRKNEILRPKLSFIDMNPPIFCLFCDLIRVKFSEKKLVLILSQNLQKTHVPESLF